MQFLKDYSPTYWNQKGKFQREADALQALVPEMGKAKDRPVELFRCFVRLYYDRYNNGCCNYDVLKDETEFLRKNREFFTDGSATQAMQLRTFLNGADSIDDWIDILGDRIIVYAYDEAVKMGLFKRSGDCLSAIKERLNNPSKARKAIKYDEDVSFLLAELEASRAVNALSEEDKKELANLRELRDNIVKAAAPYSGPTAY